MEGKWQLAAFLAAALLLHTSAAVAASIPFYCKLNEFQCTSKKIKQCISRFELCNGVKDCVDGSDENAAFCESYGCIDTQITGSLRSTFSLSPLLNSKCPSGNMCTKTAVYEGYFDTRKPWLCTGGQKDCADGSDEDPRYCEALARDCSLNAQGVYDYNHYSVAESCPSKKYCVEKDRLCDGRKDCPDGSDEWPSFCQNYTCPFQDRVSFRCKDRGCISSNDQICNGVKDCGDGSDEDPSFCSEYKCPQSRGRKCPDGRTCLRDAEICDGTNTCPDGSDEEPSFCLGFKCPGFKYKCKDGKQCVGDVQKDMCSDFTWVAGPRPSCKDESDAGNALCVPLVYSCDNTFGNVRCPGGVGCLRGGSLCDGKKDCKDGSDEGDFCKTYNCPGDDLFGNPTAVMCKNTLTCDLGSLCDGFPDCADSSDEDPALCKAYTCPEGSHKCKNFPYQCVEDRYLCDGKEQCINGGDEDKAFCQAFTCPEGFRKCPNYPYQCIELYLLCDGNKDCGNGADEDPNFCKAFNCTQGYQKCPKDPYRCVSLFSLCNGQKDCPSGGDEDPAFCKTYTCLYFAEIKCPNSSTYQCITESNLCDGYNHCLDGSDEDPALCKNYTCPEGRRRCPNSKTNACIDEFTLCDGTDNCKDGSDEDPEFCKSYICPAGRAKCPNSTFHRCIIATNMCRGSSGDCPDGSDQDPTFCAAYACPSDPYRCTDPPKCVWEYGLCNGQRDCYDGSDEDPDICNKFRFVQPPASWSDWPAMAPEGSFNFDDVPSASPMEFNFDDNAPGALPEEFIFDDAPAPTPGGI